MLRSRSKSWPLAAVALDRGFLDHHRLLEPPWPRPAGRRIVESLTALGIGAVPAPRLRGPACSADETAASSGHDPAEDRRRLLQPHAGMAERLDDRDEEPRRRRLADACPVRSASWSSIPPSWMYCHQRPGARDAAGSPSGTADLHGRSYARRRPSRLQGVSTTPTRAGTVRSRSLSRAEGIRHRSFSSGSTASDRINRVPEVVTLTC